MLPSEPYAHLHFRMQEVVWLPAPATVAISTGLVLSSMSQMWSSLPGSDSENSMILPFVPTSSFSNLNPNGVVDRRSGASGSETS